MKKPRLRASAFVRLFNCAFSVDLRKSDYFLTFTTSAAAIAGKAPPALLTSWAKIWFIKILFRDRPAPFICQFKLNRLALKAESGLKRLFTLKAIPFDLIRLSTFDKPSSCSAKNKSDVKCLTFVVQGRSPHFLLMPSPSLRIF